MTALEIVDGAAGLHEQLATASPDVLRTMVQTFAEALMSAEADAMCGAPYGARSDERVNSRNGYRQREWDTRAGTIDLAIPKLRQGRISRTGCCSTAAARSRPWCRWSTASGRPSPGCLYGVWIPWPGSVRRGPPRPREGSGTRSRGRSRIRRRGWSCPRPYGTRSGLAA